MKQLRSLTFRLLLLIIATAFLCSTTFATDPPTHSGERSLEEFLTENGSFQNPDGYSGTLNPAGFSLTVDEDGTPVFLDNSGDSNDNWTLESVEPGANNTVSAFAVDNGFLYVGGDFTSIVGLPANGIARYNINTETWETFGEGVNNSVSTLVVHDNNLYVAGSFTTAGGVAANHIAHYNLSTESWYALGSGLNRQFIHRILVHDDNLYVGGSFTSAGGVAVNNIARYNLSTESWHALGSGVNNVVYEMTLSENDLYVGGFFTEAGGNSANYIVRYDIPTGSWHALGDGVDYSVTALAILGNDLYLGGNFTTAGGVEANHIARYNISTESWHAMSGSMNDGVDILVVSGDDLYVGGIFTKINDTSFNRIARYDINTESWHHLGDGLEPFLNAISIVGNKLFAGGSFMNAGEKIAHRIAYYDLNDGNWEAMGGDGLNDVVSAIAASGNFLYVGGGFESVAGVDVNHIARYNISTGAWEALGAGTDGGGVASLLVYDDDLYVGGNFSSAGGIPAKNIARYNISTDSWYPLGKGTSGTVRDISVYKDNLIVGGTFETAGGISAYHVARFNLSTETWHALAGGGVRQADWYDFPDDYVNTLLIVDNDLYVGGVFDYAGDKSAKQIARYNLISDTWYPLEIGFQSSGNGVVEDIDYQNNTLYVAGSFKKIGDMPANHIAKYDMITKSWSSLGDGLNVFGLNSILVVGNTLFVGGRFTSTGGNPAENIASYDLENENWNALGDGVNNKVFTLTIAENNLYVGGSFTTAGGKPASHLARWSNVPEVPPKLIHFIPENNSQDIPLRPKLDWQHDDVADSYTLIVSESDDFSNPVIDEQALDPSSYQITEDLEYSTTYYWKVRGSNENGFGPWSDPWSFTTLSGPTPDKVSLQSPDNTETDIPLQPELTWEPADDAETYILKLSDEPAIEDPFIRETELSATTFKIPEDLAYNKTYYWHVRGVNTSGKGPWSDTWSFTTMSTPLPDQVTLLSPENDSKDIPLQPEFTWNPADDTESYELVLSENSDLSNSVLHQTELQETTFQISEDLDYDKTYYWHVRGINTHGNGPWSEAWSFTTVALPDQVTLLAPANNSEDIQLRPELSWSTADEIESYELVFSESSDFSDPLLHQTELMETTFPIHEDLDYNKTYYWHVRGVNSHGNGPWSEAWNFTTVPPPMPAQVTLLSPENNSQGVQLLPVLTWEVSDETDSYELVLSEEPDLSSPLLHQTKLQETTFQLTEELAYSKTYFWQVRGTNMHGEGAWSEIQSFTTIAPSEMALDPNWPNPFSNTTSGTTIRYRLPVEEHVRLEVYNISGRRVAILVNKVMPAGEHNVSFEGSGLAGGIYFYCLVADGKLLTRKMMLMK